MLLLLKYFILLFKIYNKKKLYILSFFSLGPTSGRFYNYKVVGQEGRERTWFVRGRERENRDLSACYQVSLLSIYYYLFYKKNINWL